MPKMPFKIAQASDEMKKFHLAFAQLLGQFGHMEKQDLLAVASYAVGQLLAMQDQRLMTVEMGFAVISENIEKGNQHVVGELMNNTKGSA